MHDRYFHFNPTIVLLQLSPNFSYEIASTTFQSYNSLITTLLPLYQKIKNIFNFNPTIVLLQRHLPSCFTNRPCQISILQ